MSASLVGSEMCIRDSWPIAQPPAGWAWCVVAMSPRPTRPWTTRLPQPSQLDPGAGGADKGPRWTL
eukprot:6034181-Alexandrium_andersonii.AAC.1